MLMRSFLRRSLGRHPRIRVVGEAGNGREALERSVTLRPDVLVLDVEMPVMNGIDALKAIMKRNPLPVVMFSSKTQKGAEITFEALSLGAVDFEPKPESGLSLSPAAEALCRKIVAASSAQIQTVAVCPVLPAAQSRRSGKDAVVLETTVQGTTPETARSKAVAGARPRKLVVIGASTGGPAALEILLSSLPGDLEAGIVICQHMPPGFTRPMAKRLNGKSKMKVKEAADGDAPGSGEALIVPGGRHGMLWGENWENCAIVLDKGPPVHGVHPSVDVTLRGALKTFGPDLLVVILTGMGFDGAKEARRAKNAGATVICQDEATSVVWGMPAACVQLGACHRILPLEQMAPAILEFAGGCPREAKGVS